MTEIEKQALALVNEGQLMSCIIDEGRQLAESYNRVGNGFANTDKKNAYVCESCGSYIITIDRHPGVTPFMVKCGACKEFALSKVYRVQDSLEPTHEWYRPDTLDAIFGEVGLEIVEKKP